MIQESLRAWGTPTHSFIDSTVALCREAILDAVHNTFAEWRNTALYQRILHICTSFIEQAQIEQHDSVTKLLTQEQYSPMTLDVKRCNAATEEALALLQSKRHQYRASEYLDKQDSSPDKTSRGQSRLDRLAKVTSAQIGSDPFSQEIAAVSVSASQKVKAFKAESR